MDQERRSNPRIAARVRVEFVERNKVETLTLDVSRNGMFVQGEVSRPANSFVRLRLFLPPAGQAVEVFGRVVRAGAIRGAPGIGINFLETPSADRDRWLDFVSQVENLDVSPEKGADPARDRRKAPRTESSFMVRFKSKEGLEGFFSKNLSAGGMFLPTPVLKPVGTKVQLVIIHPVNDKDFDLEAEVVRVNEDKTPEEPKGMALKFSSLTPERESQLKDFIQG